MKDVIKRYLDLCSIQRPLDRQDQLRIVLESEAVLGILAFCAAGSALFVSSETLVFEAGRTTDERRRKHSISALSLSRVFVKLSASIEARGRQLQNEGLKPMDSLHLASAEHGQADFFCTCDDRLVKRAKALKSIKVKMVTPVELAEEIERWKSK